MKSTCIILTLIVLSILIIIGYKYYKKYIILGYVDSDDGKLSSVNLRGKNITFITKDDTIGKGLKAGNYFELWMLDHIKKYYIPMTNVIDVGANIGTTSLLFEEVLTPGNFIFAIEPVYEDVLKINIKNNHLDDRIILLNLGLSNKKEIVKLKIPDYNKEQNFGGYNIENETIEKVKNENVKDVLIDKLDNLNIKNVSIIKIDVEGMEKEMLEGGLKTIEENKPVIFIEIWKKNINHFKDSDVWKKLQNIGYKIVHVGNDDYILKM